MCGSIKDKDNRFEMRISSEKLLLYKGLAEKDGLSVAEWIEKKISEALALGNITNPEP